MAWSGRTVEYEVESGSPRAVGWLLCYKVAFRMGNWVDIALKAVVRHRFSAAPGKIYGHAMGHNVTYYGRDPQPPNIPAAPSNGPSSDVANSNIFDKQPRIMYALAHGGDGQDPIDVTRFFKHSHGPKESRLSVREVIALLRAGNHVCKDWYDKHATESTLPVVALIYSDLEERVFTESSDLVTW